MKTRLFTFILLATMMISYSSCSSDDPYSNDTKTEISCSDNDRDKIVPIIENSTFICKERGDSKIKFGKVVNRYEVTMYVYGQVIQEAHQKDEASTNYHIYCDWTLGNDYGLGVKHILFIEDNNTLKGIGWLEGTWKRVK